MSLDVNLVLSALPQEGQEMVTTADINYWIVVETRTIQSKYSGVSSTDLDDLLYYKIVAIGFGKLGWHEESKLWQKRYEDRLNQLLEDATKNKTQEDLDWHETNKVNETGRLPWIL